LQVYALPERAGGGLCTLAVDDIDEMIAHARKLGIDTAASPSPSPLRPDLGALNGFDRVGEVAHAS
jgi:hypothetical protein